MSRKIPGVGSTAHRNVAGPERGKRYFRIGHHRNERLLQELERLSVLCESGPVEDNDDHRKLVNQDAHPELVVPLLDDGKDESYRDEDGKEEILHQRALCLASEVDHFRQHSWVVSRNKHVSRLEVDRLTGSDGDANIGDRQRSCVVETIPHYKLKIIINSIKNWISKMKKMRNKNCI